MKSLNPHTTGKEAVRIMRWLLAFYGLVVLAGLAVALSGCSESPTVAKEPEPTEMEVLVWEAYYNAEFNVRYRDLAGDDGFRADWAALRDKWAADYWADSSPTKQEQDARYLEKCRIYRAESEPVMQHIDAADAELRAEVEAGKWPVKPVPQSRLVKDHE